MAQRHDENGGMDLLALQQQLEFLAAEQALVVDKLLKDMNDSNLNAQLKALTEEKQTILDQIAGQQQDETQQAIQTSRMAEMQEFLAQQPMKFTEYDDEITRKLVERITVVDAETIQVKIRDTEVVLGERLH